MKWSMDTHKYMSEITRKALQVLAEAGVTSLSEPEEMDAAERKLAQAGVYKSYDGANGRIRRALFTYFKAYDCMDANEKLTEVGQAYVDNKLSVQEISFYYVVNYIYKKDDVSYYPLQLILKCLYALYQKGATEAYITPHDFSKIVDCDDLAQVNAEFVEDIWNSHKQDPIPVNERAIGYDVWAKMLVQAGVLEQHNHNLRLSNIQLATWLLDAYEKPVERKRGCLTSGVLQHFPLIQVGRSSENPANYAEEGKALQAFLFDGVSDKLISKYITSDPQRPISKMREALGLTVEQAGAYSAFAGLERLVGHSLYRYAEGLRKAIGEILINVEVTEKEDVQRMIENRADKKQYSVEELGAILAEMYATGTQKTAAIHMFGIKYGEVIKENGYSAMEIVAASGISDSYHTELSKGLRIYDALCANEYGVKFYEGEESAEKSAQKKLPVLSPRAGKKYPLNCILYGAPGTGKTYATAAYALAIVEDKELKAVEADSRQAIMQRYNQLIEDGRITFTTFHQSYGYEDFIQGMRPDISGKNGGLNFKTVNGVFKEIAERAFEDPNNDYVILIDEINRANISKVFGELITLIEDDKRWGELNAINVTLPSGEIFAVPNNLYIVGTMNSADKSISLIDTALRRRFVFIEYKPKLELIKDDTLRKVLETLNKGISDELRSTDLLIGHSYFINKTVADLPEIMNRSIIPLLYEYFFDDRKKVLAHVNKAIDGLDLGVDANPFGRVSVRKKGAEE